MNKLGLLTATIMLFAEIPGYSTGTSKSREAVRSAFMEIDSSPSILNYFNDKEINNSGGHLQGIQLFERTSGRYAVMTGSSDKYSYFSVVKLGDRNTVLSVNKLMDKPFKHAGGFQVYQDFLAVGIEDNSEKDQSKVCIFDISDPEKPGTEPIAMVKRSGEPLRSTAGCTGIAKYGNKVLLAVGDWDTKHIDLYSSPLNLSMNSIEKIYSFDIAKLSRENWIDPAWHSYQNINLFTFNDNELYMIGLGMNNDNENLADLYTLEEESPGNFTLTKIATRIFDCTKETSFKAGAGAFYGDDGVWSIVSCGYNIHESAFLNLFESRQNKP